MGEKEGETTSVGRNGELRPRRKPYMMGLGHHTEGAEGPLTSGPSKEESW